ncbi:MAG: AMP-binding protein [Planctomycetota bacterium]
MIQSSTRSIREFFTGKNVLLTGATGFLAKAVVEKILRDLPDIGQIYLLIRSRAKADGSCVDSHARLQEDILRTSAFARLREQLGAEFEKFCESKITCVSGDLTRDRLGLDEAAFADLARKIHVVINSAATVVFDERLDQALDLNTRGPGRLLDVARAGGGLYIHISTAYVSGRRTGLIPEKLLAPLEAIDAQLPPGVPRPSRFDVHEELDRLADLISGIKSDFKKHCQQKGLNPDSEQAAKQLRAALVGAGMRRAQSLGWSDTYTYTKFLGEQLVKLTHGAVPTVIVRPSIIESSLREPEPGWLDGLRMADPLIIGFGKGRLTDFPADPNVTLDIIPADLVVNAILAAATHIGACAEQSIASPANAAEGPFDLFTIASSSENPLLVRNLYEYVRDYFLKHPLTDRKGKPVQVPRWKFPTIKKYRWKVRNRYLRPIRLTHFLLGGPVTLPGTRRIRARLRNLSATLEQLLYYVDIYGPYVTLGCRFETSHARELLEALNPADRILFDFDPRRIRWRNYLQDVHIPGLKRNILRMVAPPRTGAGEGHLLDEENEAVQKQSNDGAARGVPQTIVELCRRGHERFGQKSLAEIRRATGNTRISYTEMFERSDNLARKLIARLDLHPGDRIALLGENCPEWVLAYLAISRACCVVVPLDRLMPVPEVLRLIKLVEAKAVLISPAFFKIGDAVYTANQSAPPCLNFLDDQFAPHPGHAWPCPEAAKSDHELKEPTPEMTASILFTSGATSDPKGVMLSHSNFVADAIAVAAVLAPMERDRFLSVLPLHHALEFTGGFLIPMYGGSTIHYIENIKEIETTMKLAGITVVIGVPRLFKLFMDRIQSQIAAASAATRLTARIGKGVATALEAAGNTSARRHIFKKVHEAFGGNLRLFVSGGAALDTEIFNCFKDFGIPIIEGYGLTETSPVLTVNPLSAPKAGAVGPPVPGVEICIDAPNIENIGRVLARGPTIMQCYWRNPAATEKVFENGWFDTGDLGRIDSDGYLRITGRLKDVIITAAGKNVYPDEVESALRGIPGIKEYCVLGLPARSDVGEEVAVIIFPEHDRNHQAIEAAIGCVNATLPSHQRVARVEFWNEELPKTSTLKLQRAKLREQIARADTLPRERTRDATGPLPNGRGSDKREQITRADAPTTDHTLESELFVEVARAVAAVAGRITPAEGTPTMKLQMDLGIDSIGRVDLLQKLESQLGVTIPHDRETTLFTVRDLLVVASASLPAASKKARSTPAAPRAMKSIWDRSKQRQDNVHDDMRQTVSKRVLQRLFGASASAIMHTYLRLHCYGLENVPARAPYILAANHCSHLDAAAIRDALGRRAMELYAMGARDYFFNTRLKSWFFATFLNVLPFDRDENVTESLALCKTVLENNRAILLFPEGTRSISGELQAFKPGVGVLGIELDAPVIPVHLRGTYDALPKGRWLPRPTRLELRIGPAVDFSALKAARGATSQTELYRRAANEVRAQIEALADERLINRE